MRWLVLVLLFAASPGFLLAQHAPAATAEKNVSPLKAVIEPLGSALTDLEQLRKELKQAASEEAKLEIQGRIDAERERIRQLRGNFRDILGGAEAAEYEGNTPIEVNLQDQIGELLQPILGELREPTARPRELEALRKSLGLWNGRKQKADAIVLRIDGILATAKDDTLVVELNSARRLWTGRQAEASGQIGVIRSQIEERESVKQSLWETLSNLFSKFFRSRGMNLLLAVLVGVLGFVITRRGYLLLRRFSPVHRGETGNLTGRVSDLLAVAVAVLVALIGVLLVFFIRGDWLLLTLTLLLLFGIAWAGKAALPPYVEQVRMMLNMGAVREGERLVHLGLPWKVGSIGFFTRFINPNLDGGVLRIPIRDLMTMTSREPDAKEPWFPTEPDDWAVLSDGTYGKVITQTPEQVVFLRLGGSMKTLIMRFSRISMARLRRNTGHSSAASRRCVSIHAMRPAWSFLSPRSRSIRRRAREIEG